jgi:hypothetical protein
MKTLLLLALLKVLHSLECYSNTCVSLGSFLMRANSVKTDFEAQDCKTTANTSTEICTGSDDCCIIDFQESSCKFCPSSFALSSLGDFWENV